MAVPPVCDAFDTWDKTPEIPLAGHNTETTLMVFGLEAGVCLAVAWASILLLDGLAAWFAPRVQKAPAPIRSQVRATDYLMWIFSPPWTFASLRI